MGRGAWSATVHGVAKSDTTEWLHYIVIAGFPWWLSGKESACDAGAAGDAGWIPGSGRSPGEGHGNTFQYSCLENPMDREAWWAIVHRVPKNRTWPSTHAYSNWYLNITIMIMESLWASLVAQLVKNLPAMWETWVWSLGWEDSLENGKATHSSILAWRIPWTV